MTSVRRRRRQRGKRKALRKESLETWNKLTNVSPPLPPEYDWDDLGAILMPLMRRIAPVMIADDLVGVQPMGEQTAGIEPVGGFHFDFKTETFQDPRKKKRAEAKRKRAAAKRRRDHMEEIIWGNTTPPEVWDRLVFSRRIH